ncbi:hypothetical protein AOC19_02985 [Polynucleobacter asymbioticus]|uniref:hypothetical protein n=1 Tax=Polynucleobacter asymbioticus TaxID=576611 RepID=UPI001BFE41D2|nr:hypothetical protein [Polynucleobacter asymbioticus]QWD85851.1 hypothetical protein AOC19_02985 [Polynucleobacter asymbioticus]
MRKLIVQFLIVALFSLNSYAGPLVDRNRPDIRPGQRGSIAQNALGSNHDQYSILNPGSNQSVFVRNNILLQQQYGNNANTNGYLTFNPQSSLLGSGATASLDAMAKHLLETNGGNAQANRVTPSPFASKVAKSQTQGIIFLTQDSQSYVRASKESLPFPEIQNLPGLTMIPYIFASIALIDTGLFAPIGASMLVASAISILESGNIQRAKIIQKKLSSPEQDKAQLEAVNLVAKDMADKGIPSSEAKKIAPALIAIALVLNLEQAKLGQGDKEGIYTSLQTSCPDCSIEEVKSTFLIAQNLVSKNPAMWLRSDQLEAAVSQVFSSDYGVVAPVVSDESGKRNLSNVVLARPSSKNIQNEIPSEKPPNIKSSMQSGYKARHSDVGDQGISTAFVYAVNAIEIAVGKATDDPVLVGAGVVGILTTAGSSPNQERVAVSGGANTSIDPVATTNSLTTPIPPQQNSNESTPRVSK